MKKEQETEAFDFKRKQELELQAFMKRQKEEASGFHTNHTNQWNDLKERHTQVRKDNQRLLPPHSTSPSSGNVEAFRSFSGTARHQPSNDSQHVGRLGQEGGELHALQPLLLLQQHAELGQHVVVKTLASDLADLPLLLVFLVSQPLGAIDEVGPHRATVGRHKSCNTFREHPRLLEPPVICRIGDHICNSFKSCTNPNWL